MNTFARRVFLVAGIYGLIVLLPLYFMRPAALARPEDYFGFIGTAVAWQLCFLVISRDPPRLRPIMLPAIVEKLVFSFPVLILVSQHRMAPTAAVFAAIDLLLGALFYISWRHTTGELPPLKSAI
ncbi:MAG: hypothetical protein H0U66_13445 [Gemmatimonadaceae bacterium]|nr:hypothetical protein [Gemmatimonadaceae bacterium]